MFMKNYTIIPNEVCEKLSPRDLYVLTVMYLSADERYKTDITLKQLCDYTTSSMGYLQNQFLKRLKSSGLVKLKSYFSGRLKRRNEY